MSEHPVVYSRSAALAGGLTWRSIQADGVRVGRGAWLSRSVAPTMLNACRAWSTVLPAEGAFGLETAAELWGAPLARPPARLHFVVPTGVVPPRHPTLTAVTRALAPEDVVTTGGIRLTGGARTWVDLAASTPDDELLAIGDHLLRSGRMTADDVSRLLARCDGARGIVRARARAPQLDAAAMSRPESLIRVWLIDSDLPDPEVQPAVLERWGREVAHPDLGWRRWRVYVEYEGDGHRSVEQFGSDVERYTQMAADDLLLLRFARRHLRQRDVVLDHCRRALTARGWHPGC